MKNISFALYLSHLGRIPTIGLCAVSISLLALTTTAQAEVSCFAIAEKNSPERTPQAAHSTSNWCFEIAPEGHLELTMISKVEGGKIRPELSMLVERDASGKVLAITHGSLNKGEMSIHKMAGFLSPLGGPLSRKEAVASGGVKMKSKLSSAGTLDFHNMSSRLLNFQGSVVHANVFAGTFEANISDDKTPWDGYWWDDSQLELAHGPLSPLGKYDSITKSMTGIDPQSSAWEIAHHSPSGVPWGGHCNGWAASSVLYPEPTRTLWDAANKQLVFPSDIKGMLAEASFCVNWAFYGNRYYGNPGDDLNDIDPVQFHKVLTYYIGGLNKPVALDYVQGVSVDNSVIGGYKFQIDAVPGSTNLFKVTAELKRYHYSNYRDERIGPAHFDKLFYYYLLTLDAQGNIASGTWTTGPYMRDQNPDFLWVPLSPAVGHCGWRNENIDPAQVVAIANSLPDAAMKSVDLNLDFDVATPNQRTQVPLPPTLAPGAMYRVNYEYAGPMTNIYLIGTGPSAYPSIEHDSETERWAWSLSSQDFSALLPIYDLSKLEFNLPDAQPGVKIKIKSIDYFPKQ